MKFTTMDAIRGLGVEYREQAVTSTMSLNMYSNHGDND